MPTGLLYLAFCIRIAKLFKQNSPRLLDKTTEHKRTICKGQTDFPVHTIDLVLHELTESLPFKVDSVPCEFVAK